MVFGFGGVTLRCAHWLSFLPYLLFGPDYLALGAADRILHCVRMRINMATVLRISLLPEGIEGEICQDKGH